MLPVLILGGMILVFFVHPDPKEIGMHLERYYPDYIPPPKLPAGQEAQFNSWDLLRRVPTRLAILSNCAGQGNMAIVMVLTSLVLSHHGYSLTAIAFSHSFHAAGMFAFTIPLGWASDRLRPRMGDVSGRRHGADWRAVRRLLRGIYLRHARHIPGRARLVLRPASPRPR